MGPAALYGLIQSGPTAGLLTFKGDATVAGGAAGFYWRLQRLVDNSSSSPGVGWNALAFTSTTQFGVQGAGVQFYLDFSALGNDPDGGDPFWKADHTWTLITFPAEASIWWASGNFAYGAGTFNINVDWVQQVVQLTWTPAGTTQNLFQRMATRAALRRKAASATPRPIK